MTKTIRATFDGSVLRPEEPVDLPQNESIEITIILPEHKAGTTADKEIEAGDDPLQGLRFDGPVDLAEQFDDYRFGRRP